MRQVRDKTRLLLQTQASKSIKGLARNLKIKGRQCSAGKKKITVRKPRSGNKLATGRGGHPDLNTQEWKGNKTQVKQIQLGKARAIAEGG